MNSALLVAVLMLPPQSPVPPQAPPVIDGIDVPSGRTITGVIVAPLSVTVADRGCDPCDRWEREALPQLASRGWLVGKHYTVRRVPLGSEPTPTFVWRGKGFAASGYGGWESWRADLAGAMGLQVRGESAGKGRPAPVETGAAVIALPAQAAAPVYLPPRPVYRTVRRTAGWHTHTCDACGNSWSHGRESHGNYAAHRCSNCGRLEWN
jgi:hypothetical protein